jgi:hypothetical protein
VSGHRAPLLARARDYALELVAINAAEQKVLVNLTTSDCDSVAQEIVALRDYGVPHDVISRALGRVFLAIELNGLEGAIERDLAGQLDSLATAAHNGDGVAEQLGIHAIARALRPALRVLNDLSNHDSIEIVRASAIVLDVVRAHPAEMLGSDALRRQLRPTAHDKLLELAAVWTR